MTTMNDDTAHAVSQPADDAARDQIVDSLGQIAELLRTRGLPTDERVVLLDFDESGLVVLTVDFASRAVVSAQADDDIGPATLDRMIADHLIRVGRVDRPTSADWDRELLDLVAQGRQRLRASDGTFIMGRRHLRLFRLARRDVEEPTRQLIAQVETLTRGAVSNAGGNVVAVVAADGVRNWPGLRDSIARAVAVPVLDLDVPETPVVNAHVDADDLGSADFPVMPPVVVPEMTPAPESAPMPEPAATVEPVPTPVPEPEPMDEPEPVAAPEPIAADDRPTEPIPVVATSLAYSEVEEVAPDDELMPDDVVDVAPAPPSRTRGLLSRASGRRVAAVVGAVAVFALVGVATAFALGGDSTSDNQAAAESVPSSPAQPSYADPAVLAEARLPAARYTPPPPPPPPRSAPDETTPGPRPRQRPRPRPRLTIPLPGLPPIVIP